MSVWGQLASLPPLGPYARLWVGGGKGTLISHLSLNPVTCQTLCGSAHMCLCTHMSVHTRAYAHACLGWGVCLGCAGTQLGSNQSCLQCRHLPRLCECCPHPRSWLQGPTVPCAPPAHMSSVPPWLSPRCNRPNGPSVLPPR